MESSRNRNIHTVKHDRPQNKHPEAYVIAQEYSSANSVSSHFHTLLRRMWYFSKILLFQPFYTCRIA